VFHPPPQRPSPESIAERVFGGIHRSLRRREGDEGSLLGILIARLLRKIRGGPGPPDPSRPPPRGFEVLPPKQDSDRG
jgi:hypothetical protein